jgi:hypothetical protein
MTEVRIERLGAGDHEEHRAKRQEPDIATAQEKAHAVKGIERREHAQILRHMPSPADGEHREQHERDGAEEGGDPCRVP